MKKAIYIFGTERINTFAFSMQELHNTNRQNMRLNSVFNSLPNRTNYDLGEIESICRRKIQ